MATLLYRIGKWCSRRHWTVIGVWALLLTLISGAAMTLKGPTTTQLTIPGTPFSQVLDELRTEIPAAAGGSGTVVFHPRSGTFSEAQKKAIADVVAQWKTVPNLIDATDPFVVQAQIDGTAAKLAASEQTLATEKAKLTAGEQELAAGKARLQAGEAQLVAAEQMYAKSNPKDPKLGAQLTAGRAQLEAAKATMATSEAKLAAGREQLAAADAQLAAGKRQAALVQGLRFVSSDNAVAMSQVRFDKETQSVDPASLHQVQTIANNLGASGIAVDYSTELTMDVNSVIGPGEAVGVVVAGLVLLVTLGSLIAAGLPVLMALIGVGVGIGGTMALTKWIEMHQITPMLGLMLGLAVGIDYSLFIVNRHRIQLVHGSPLHESVGRATGTSGSAVTFAGLTVLIALAALAVTGIPFLGLMGYVGAATVAVSILVAITLTPAMLGLIGPRILSKKSWAAAGFDRAGMPSGSGPDDDHTPHGKARWGRFVTGHPFAALLLSVVVLGVIAIPAASLRLGLPDGGSEPADSTAYRAYSLVDKYFGPGANGPIIAVSHLKPGADPAGATMDVAERLAKIPGIDRVVPFGTNAAKTVAAFQMVPHNGPADERTIDTVNTIRDQADQVLADTGSTVAITGRTVANIDVSAKLAEALPKYLAIVVGLSLVILIMVFRSILVPVLATVGFLLSLAAAFGAVVAVYQWGWLGSVFGITNPAPMLSFLPTLLIGVLFGLAMDYQMFLVTGMREAHQHGEDARAAVFSGYQHGARVVTAAAIIMVSVFSGFIFAHLTMVRPIGFGLAVGIALDAFLVRMTLTPAVLHLIGEKAWWLPRWMDRIVPEVDVEGVKLLEHLDHPVPTVGAAGDSRARVG